MVTGMGTVFVFLTLLVFSTWLMSKIVVAIERRREALAPIDIEPPEGSHNEELIAVISAAIRQHRHHRHHRHHRQRKR